MFLQACSRHLTGPFFHSSQNVAVMKYIVQSLQWAVNVQVTLSLPWCLSSLSHLSGSVAACLSAVVLEAWLVLWHWSYSVLVQSGVTRGQEEGSIRSSVKEKVKTVWIHSVKKVCVCVWVWNARLVLFIYLYVCILACDCLLVFWVRDCVSHVRFYERVSVHHQRWWERWKVVGLAGRFQWGRAELTDIQEELVVTLLPFTKLPRGQTRVVQQLTDYRQVALLCLLVKGKERERLKIHSDSRL